jgi:hypothetical protein
VGDPVLVRLGHLIAVRQELNLANADLDQNAEWHSQRILPEERIFVVEKQIKEEGHKYFRSFFYR